MNTADGSLSISEVLEKTADEQEIKELEIKEQETKVQETEEYEIEEIEPEKRKPEEYEKEEHETGDHGAEEQQTESQEPQEQASAPHKYTDEEIRLTCEEMLADLELYPQELYDAINQIFDTPGSMEQTVTEIKAVYEDYGNQTNRHNNSRTVLKPEAMLFYFGEGGFTQLAWNEVANIIHAMRETGEYVPAPSRTEGDDRIGDYNIPDEMNEMQDGRDRQGGIHQLDLFEMYPGPYEDDEPDRDLTLLEDGTAEEIKSGYIPFSIGTRILYDSRILEVLAYLDDNQTAELGDVEQRGAQGGFFVRERLPVGLIQNARVLQAAHTSKEGAKTEDRESSHGTEDGAGITEGTGYTESVEGTGGRDAATNYHFSPEHHLYDGGPKTKFRNNVAAIRLLKELQEQGRMATKEEQTVLARFVGWGGLANALTPGKAGWEDEYAEIEKLLTEEEMQSAAESTLTSYYTDQTVISHIYKALKNFGFHSGNILDPAVGTGNFFSALPESMSQSRLYGVELEPVAGGIARQLYPKADIFIKGYEDTQFSDSFFDVVVGNIPFNRIKVSDRRYDRYNFMIHDYFIAKSLDKVRSGGILALITSKFTLDKENQSVRKYIAQRAELIGAIRLPETAFKAIAGTEAVTDILFLKKRVQEMVLEYK